MNLIVQFGLSLISVPKTTQKTEIPSPFWKYFALTEMLVIIILIVVLFLKKRKGKLSERELISEAKNAQINMNDLMLDINNSKSLYKQLSKKCHPDLFVGTPIHNEVESLFKDITENRRNYNELERLKKIAVEQLNIKL